MNLSLYISETITDIQYHKQAIPTAHEIVILFGEKTAWRLHAFHRIPTVIP